MLVPLQSPDLISLEHFKDVLDLLMDPRHMDPRQKSTYGCH